ncbi:TEL2-interacting protein 1 [Tolypocladium paradoxum]|uniref:TEL2-interacting protein 1 n=1 Tax=Tolypocladium paradoxum TaxID=94208 RepID=A0A2S4L634_9HYPO|nr:TEL2-interacting protein 1 [Tolypocladium paradoxum]
MDTTPSTQERNALFQKLKPCCIKISQLAIRETETPDAPRELQELTGQVLGILNEQIERNPAALDDKLAEYVFFPLYHIFRQMDRYPMLLVENCVKCLHILITHGWKSKLSAKLVQQILSLLIFIIDGVPGSQNKREVPEETALEAFRAQTTLLYTAASSVTASSGLAEQDTLPVLGHGITVMLDGAVVGANPQIQQEALRSLRGMYLAIREHEVLASFLPGIISALAKMLSSPNRYKAAVLTGCLETVQLIVTRVLGDMRTRSILAQGQSESQDDESDKRKVLNPTWLKATVSQVKLALSTMMKLRTQDAPQVREALERLCVALLDECHITLSNCTTILVETAIILDNGVDAMLSTQTSLSHLVNIYPELGEAAKTTVYNWMSSLSRIMQISDEDSKRIAVHNLSKGLELLQSLGLESTTLDDSISSTLKDTMVSLVLASSQQANPSTQLQLLDGNTPVGASSNEPLFQPVLLASQGQRGLMTELMALIDSLGSASQKAKIAASMMEYVRESSSVDQIAAMWLCYELLKAANASSAAADAFLDLSAFTGPPEDSDAVFNDLYGFAVQVLDSHMESDAADWRLEALSLEVTTYAAHRSGIAFRPELIDVLFPIATLLGSENPGLQQHAIAALNGISLSCQYASVSELIIDNVDYMVNSVSLRLNTLDVSPASMQVLLMMIRLAGPRLIPFLDDVVDSIFAALDSYHGYTFFVESLFSVLKEVVDQASRTDQRLLTDRERETVDHKKRPPKKDGLDDILAFLDKRAERRARDAAEAASGKPIEGYPKAPWASEPAGEDGEEESQEQAGAAPSEEKPPNSPTYQLLLRIASLTQHYLTSPTPKLRRSLLELLTTASSILAGDEDAFLPLVNAVWPVVISRLYDSEPFITVEACYALSGLCEAAGDFLSSRFKTEWGDGLGDWCRKVKQQASSGPNRSRPSKENKSISASGKGILIPIRSGGGLEGKETGLEAPTQSSGSLGQHASPVRVWEAVVKLLTAIISYVQVDDEMFDQILDLLSDVLEKNQEVRGALETLNADAVWLVRYERGYIEPLPTPEMEGVKFAEMVQMPRG